MVPQPVDLSPSLKKIDGVRYLVWDLYGTLLMSTAGTDQNASLHETTLRSLLLDSSELPHFSLRETLNKEAIRPRSFSD